ncbi:arsenate reductase-like glutaredoxin family protein [Natronobacillus azotifigens]|uniref:Glutaredoxin family protein n=1 Tax=Natronobacillus azotifigens TaxID=472978 RepID=A0A9J6RAX8_9BACI|nr:glutaredoxin family protein [Natronobacillus azotifigens]MCZ0702695.1 glutaredoxin family protein [Natronobacillus azotifigens]
MKAKEIIVYVSNDCQESRKIMNFLEQLDVMYEKRNISENKAYLTELQRRNIYSTPVVIIDENIILGFQKNKITNLLHYGMLDKNEMG